MTGVTVMTGVSRVTARLTAVTGEKEKEKKFLRAGARTNRR